ncbi:hypothetical protein GCM10009547_40580 [Sporichthya brevicatena]|uniref:SnoaL-like polyketide cyclase n=1 Tax=Sporichthya brevicatena TaxID=171442 RepID=A0ABN1H8I2_9ACTN
MSGNVAIVEHAIECLNNGDLEGYMSMYSPDAQFVGYPAQVPPTYEGVKAFYADLLRALGRFEVETIDLFGAGERVVARFTLSGFHDEELLGAEPTKHGVSIEGLTILYFVDGKVMHRVNRIDELSFLNQIGIIPTPGATSTG